jgi:HSP20 family protein
MVEAPSDDGSHLPDRKENEMSNLIRRDPLDDFFRGFFVRPVDFAGEKEAPVVKIDVKEQEKNYLVHAEVPGVKKEDIHVEHRRLRRIDQRRAASEEKDVKEGERVLRSERYVGKVSRSFQFGAGHRRSAGRRRSSRMAFWN